MSLKYRQMCMRCISAVDIHVVNTLNKYANFIQKTLNMHFLLQQILPLFGALVYWGILSALLLTFLYTIFR